MPLSTSTGSWIRLSTVSDSRFLTMIARPRRTTPRTGWAETSAHWLMEELDTGGMRRAVRKHVADTVVLDFEVECSDAKRNFTISAVVPTEAGIAALISSGLVDVARAREQMNAGRLLSWLCAWADGTHRRVPIGHIAVSWLPNQECIAKLVFVQTVDGLDGEIRGEVVQSLLAAAHHQATEAGAVTRLFQDYELQNTDDA